MERWTDWYERVVIEPGKQPLLLLLIAFIVTFVLTRILVRAIREGRGPGRNVAVNGVHLHHVVFGVVLVVAAGVGGFSRIGSSWPWAEVFAAVFGVGAALVLDEFALILRLDDVYWQREGRLSVNAVFIGAALCGLVLVGVNPLGVEERLPDEAGYVQPTWELFLIAAVNTVAVLVCVLKGKVATGLLGIVVPFIALVGAIRLARPNSPWGRARYEQGSAKAQKSLERERRFRRSRWARTRDRVYDVVAGAPTETQDSTAERQPSH